MNPRNRINEIDASALLAASATADGVKFVFALTGIGLLVNWFIIAPTTYVTLSSWMHLGHDVGWTERVGWRVVCYLLLGGMPASTTIGTLVTIGGVWIDDARYNAKEMHENS